MKKFSQYRHGYTNVHTCTWVIQDPVLTACGHLVCYVHCHVLQEVGIRSTVIVVDLIIGKYCLVPLRVGHLQEPQPQQRKAQICLPLPQVQARGRALRFPEHCDNHWQAFHSSMTNTGLTLYLQYMSSNQRMSLFKIIQRKLSSFIYLFIYFVMVVWSYA